MKAEDIKIGETYSFLDLMGIIDTAIIFDKRTMDYSSGTPRGKVIYVGNDFIGKVDSKDIVLVKHHDSEILNENFEGEG